MSDHTSAVFNNSCLKMPRNPVSKRPFPVCDQKFMHQLENQARKLSLDSENLNIRARGVGDRTLKSLIEFYDSIPDYDDLNHLSNKAFYRRLEILKEQQRDYYECTVGKDNRSDWVEDYKNLGIEENPGRRGRRSVHRPPIINVTRPEDNESVSSCEKDAKPPSRRSVRIESPSETPDLKYFRSKSRANASSAGSKGSFWDVSSLDESNLTTRSAPGSPCKTKTTSNWKDTGITIPKPFEMTVRDEENKIVDDILAKTKKPPPDDKRELFRANPVPIESQIPLFDKIMADREKRRQNVKKRSKATLRAQMRPFSFTRRDEEIRAITGRLSKSSPCVYLDSAPVKHKPFRAKPIPKHVFSDYIYHKMNEDEFYRALQKKIRSEEMLKASSLPPSMAKRETKGPKYVVCPRSFRDFDIDERLAKEIAKSKNRNGNEDVSALDKELRELEDLENDFLRSKRCKTRSKSNRSGHRQCSSAETKSTNRPFSAMDAVSRSNLAAVLRIQSARRKMETEMCGKLEEAKLREEARWKERVMRRKPIWESLQCSHEEDLAMRLQLRRDEERLRSEEHKHRMQVMLGRVRQQPTLFERQSNVRSERTREELIAKLYEDLRECSSSGAIETRAVQAVERRESVRSERTREELMAKLYEDLRECSSSGGIETRAVQAVERRESVGLH